MEAEYKAWLDRVPSWLVFVLSLAFALVVWFWWLTIGIGVAHKQVVAFAPPQASVSASATSAPDRAAMMAELGLSGDAFGGANAFFAAVAGGLVLWAGVIQSRSLNEARAATRQARAAYEEERRFNRREQVSSTFFQMLALCRELVERIDNGLKADANRTGAAALDHFAHELDRRLDERGISVTQEESQAAHIATTYIGTVYDAHPSQLGPYFRLLFQTFKLLAESELDDATQIQLANVARGQISEGAVLLMAANGLTERGFKFIPLIEKFGLLEHMHAKYRNKYKKGLLHGFRQRAFMGSKERSSYQWELTPKCGPDAFMTWDHDPTTTI
jgi:Putative phage abortive infection protein